MAEPGKTATNLCCEHHHRDQEKPHDDKQYQLNLPTLKQIRNKPTASHCVIIFYILFGLLLLITALADLGLSATNSILTRSYDSKASGRIFGSVILSICAVIAILAAFYAINALLCKNDAIGKKKALRMVSSALFVLMIIQALVVTYALTAVKKGDNHYLESSLTESFINGYRNADEANIQLWDILQSEFKCCGLIGPDDYRDPNALLNPPDIPFSCCKAYQKNETEFFAKWKRDLCIKNKTYHTDGCTAAAAKEFHAIEVVTVGVSILLIVFELIVFAFGLYLSKKGTKNHEEKKEPSKTGEVEVSA